VGGKRLCVGVFCGGGGVGWGGGGGGGGLNTLIGGEGAMARRKKEKREKFGQKPPLKTAAKRRGIGGKERSLKGKPTENEAIGLSECRGDGRKELRAPCRVSYPGVLGGGGKEGTKGVEYWGEKKVDSAIVPSLVQDKKALVTQTGKWAGGKQLPDVGCVMGGDGTPGLGRKGKLARHWPLGRKRLQKRRKLRTEKKGIKGPARDQQQVPGRYEHQGKGAQDRAPFDCKPQEKHAAHAQKRKRFCRGGRSGRSTARLRAVVGLAVG